MESGLRHSVRGPEAPRSKPIFARTVVLTTNVAPHFQTLAVILGGTCLVQGLLIRSPVQLKHAVLGDPSVSVMESSQSVNNKRWLIPHVTLCLEYERQT